MILLRLLRVAIGQRIYERRLGGRGVIEQTNFLQHQHHIEMGRHRTGTCEQFWFEACEKNPKLDPFSVEILEKMLGI